MDGETPRKGLSHEVEEPVMVSAIEHFSYCPRQYALIHVEQVFEENLYTLRGRAVHEKVDEGDSTVEGGVRVERGLPIWSVRLSLVGKADIVEFHGDTPYPVEYKHGPRRSKEHDDLQLCAQALCLEEMFGVKVESGAVYHYSSRKRREVFFDHHLREKVEETLRKMREVRSSGILPPPVNDRRCRNCSLFDSCMPSAVGEKRRLRRLKRTLFVAPDGCGE